MRAMNRQVLQLHIDHQAEQQAADAEQQSDRQKGMSVHAEKIHGRQIRQHQVGFASARVFRLRRKRMWEAAGPGRSPWSCTGASEMPHSLP